FADFDFLSGPAGDGNTLLGYDSRVKPGLSNAAAIGGNAYVTQSNSLILGSILNQNGATADTNVGIGTTAPSQRLHVVGNGLFTGNLTVNGTFTGSVTASSISGVVSIANGGTGTSSSPSAAGQFLRSSGAGAWGVAVLSASDIPSGS